MVLPAGRIHNPSSLHTLDETRQRLEGLRGSPRLCVGVAVGGQTLIIHHRVLAKAQLTLVVGAPGVDGAAGGHHEVVVSPHGQVANRQAVETFDARGN